MLNTYKYSAALIFLLFNGLCVCFIWWKTPILCGFFPTLLNPASIYWPDFRVPSVGQQSWGGDTGVLHMMTGWKAVTPECEGPVWGGVVSVLFSLFDVVCHQPDTGFPAQPRVGEEVGGSNAERHRNPAEEDVQPSLRLNGCGWLVSRCSCCTDGKGWLTEQNLDKMLWVPCPR